jgi:hypothetical protein
MGRYHFPRATNIIGFQVLILTHVRIGGLVMNLGSLLRTPPVLIVRTNLTPGQVIKVFSLWGYSATTAHYYASLSLVGRGVVKWRPH